jgi:ATP-dependent Clp protease ATP-binding subunit ClpA
MRCADFSWTIQFSFRRFTDRAVGVMVMARKQAIRRGQAAVTPEHVLLALAMTEAGVGRFALERLGLDLEAEGPAIAALVGEDVRAEPGQRPDLGPDAQQLIREAITHAPRLGHRYVGTEHLILALLDARSPAGDFLRSRGITPESLRDSVLTILGFAPWTYRARRVFRLASQGRRRTSGDVVAGDVLRALIDSPRSLAAGVLTAVGINLVELRALLVAPGSAKEFQVIEQANAESRRRGDRCIGTEHLLLAAVRQIGGQPAEMLAAHGATAERLEQLLDKAVGQSHRRRPPLMRRLGAACRAVIDRVRAHT